MKGMLRVQVRVSTKEGETAPPPPTALTQMPRYSLSCLDLNSRGRGNVGVLSQDLERELAGRAIQ